MSERQMKTQPHVSSEDGEIFDVSFNTDEVSLHLIELTYTEIKEILHSTDIQVNLLRETYLKRRNSRGETP